MILGTDEVSVTDEPGESFRIQRPPGDSDSGNEFVRKRSSADIETIFDVGYESEASEESESDRRAGELEGWEEIYDKIMEGAGLSEEDWKKGAAPELVFA